SEIKEESAKQGNAFQRAIRSFGDVFVPIIPALVATGLFMGLRGLVLQEEILALFGLTPGDISENFILFTQVLTDTAFIFLPALVAWSTFRVFGGNPTIGLVLGLMLV
ncbi:PTS sugar transporter subunit IIA, partial [Staphylococcus sp. SIMBA_130]